MATAAASWMSTRSRSESSGFGVPVVSSGAITAIEESLPGRFSLPPIRDGRTAFPCALPVVEANSGVAELLRLVVDGLGRF